MQSHRFIKRQAHCSECGHCFYDSFFLGYRCSKTSLGVTLVKFACKSFWYRQADLNPNWEEEFIFGWRDNNEH